MLFCMSVKNRAELVSHGFMTEREIALEIIEYALRSVDPYKAVKRLIRLTNENLLVGHLSFNLSKIGAIYVLGAGKASFPIAKALEDVLGKRIKSGVIIEKKGQKPYELKKIKVIEGGHPIPDEAGVEGAKEIVKIAKHAKEDDIVFCPLTGGASALMPLPAEGISLEDKKRVTDLLLKSGATIQDINVVRKHISAIKGGRLAKYIHPAEIITLTFPNMLHTAGKFWPDPTLPDPSTFQDAVLMLKKYGIWENTPLSIKTRLQNADPGMETPKDFSGMRVHTFSVGSKEIACKAAKKKSETLGYKSVILSSMIEGESREVGSVLACIAREIQQHGRPLEPACTLIVGGEAKPTIEGESGEGGPNQELCLGFSLRIAGLKNTVIAAIDTDGTDGPTEIAGGIADGLTLRRANEKGIDLYGNLRKHNSSYVLRKLCDAIVTGPTGTHVMSLMVVVVGKDKEFAYH